MKTINSKTTTTLEKYPALPVLQGNNTFYVATLRASTLYPCAKVSRAEEDPELGYQRLLEVNRIKKIAKYIETGSIIPGCIILSASEGSNLKYDEGFITFNKKDSPFMIVDGQHRLAGAYQLWKEKGKDTLLICSILTGLSVSEEARYFYDINTSQKGVPRALRIEISKLFTPEDTPEHRRLLLFKELNENPSSVLFGKMSRTSTKKGAISHATFQDAISPLLTKYPLDHNKSEIRLGIMINFLQALHDILLEDSKVDKLTNSAFFQAIMKVFPEICARVLQRQSNFKYESFLDVLEPISNIRWDDYTGTNKQTITALSSHILELLARNDQNLITEDLI